MNEPHCPGRDLRYWKPEDISFPICPWCGGEVEIWKDEPARACPSCGKQVHNPKLDPDCGKWCPKAKECPGARGLGEEPPGPPASVPPQN